MAKPNPLQSALKGVATPARSVPAPATEPASRRPLAQTANDVSTPMPETHRTPSRAPSREGRVLVGAHFAPEVQTALKIIAAQERTTIQELLAEGIDAVFAKRGKPEIASLPAQVG